MLSFLIGYTALIVSSSVSAAFSLLFGIAEIVHVLILGLFVDVLIYTAFYRLIRLKNTVSLISDIEVKGIIFAITGIALVFFGNGC